MNNRYLDFPGGIRALVVAGGQDSRKTIARILEDWGCHVDQEGGGKAALDRAAGTDFDLVLADLELPDMPGAEFYRRMAELYRDGGPPIICVTEPDDDATLRAVFAAGARDFLFKPLRPVELEARAWVALQKARETGEGDGSGQSGPILEEAGAVCHELNQPLQFVLGMVQLALMDVNQDQPLYDQLKAIQEKIEQMGSITGRLVATIKSGIASGPRAKNDARDQQ